MKQRTHDLSTIPLSQRFDPSTHRTRPSSDGCGAERSIPIYNKHTSSISSAFSDSAKAHRKHQEWSPQRFLRWAAKTVPYTVIVSEHQLAGRHPEHGYRACLGLLHLTKRYGKARLEAACRRAQHIGSMNYKSIASILENSLDKIPLETTSDDKQSQLPLTHDNVRGAEYYH